MRYLVRFIVPTLFFLMVFQNMGNSENGVLDLGLSAEHYQEGEVPAGWKLRKFPGKTRGASAHWVKEAGIDERSKGGDDHPIRIFFVFDPDESKQSLLFRLKRILYLDLVHGHPMGGRFTEYLWSSHLKPGDIINDPGKPMQKLMVIEGGEEKLGLWLSYERNLYEDFKSLYGEEPRRLIFIGILNDMDQAGQEAVSYIADLKLIQLR